MSSSDNDFDVSKIINPEKVEEIIKIDKPCSALTFSEATGLVSIDLSSNSAAGKAFSNIYIIKTKHKRCLIVADVNNVYSSAQIKDRIDKNKKTKTPEQILKYYGINKKDYLFHKISKDSEPILTFRSQKLISSYTNKIKIDCPNYVIISES